MKRSFAYTSIRRKALLTLLTLCTLLLCLPGCSPIGDKSASLSIVYAAATALSFALLLCHFRLVNKRNAWLTLLFCSVLVVNAGYFLLSVSTSLEQALMANRLSYLGSVLLMPSMLMIILNETNTKYGKALPSVLGAVAFSVFLVTASPGILDVYYKEVSFAVVNGVSTLIKVYGPLHPVYMLYLAGYFAAMVAVIARASAKKRVQSATHAVVLAVAVLVNIGVWLIEQLVHIDFEVLSVSYIISESFLLGIYLMANENERLSGFIDKMKEAGSIAPEEATDDLATPNREDSEPERDRYEMFADGLTRLTRTERAIYEAYIARSTTKEIMATMGISENTLKFHNKNLYRKLGVSSRRELMEIYKQIKTMSEL